MSADPVVYRYLPLGSELPAVAMSAAELGELSRLRDPGRRNAWMSGRKLAHQLLREHLRLGGAGRLEICSRDVAGKSVRPIVRVNAEPADVCLSISHSDRGVLVALSTEGRIGVDLVDRDGFTGSLNTWFTGAERELLEKQDPSQQAVLWGIKEAVYKAANEGEPFAPKRFQVQTDGIEHHCRYDGADNSLDDCRITIREIDAHVAVFAVLPIRVNASCL